LPAARHGHTNAQCEQHLAILRANQAAAWKDFYKLKSANESVWAEFKSHMDKAGAETRAAVEPITTNFKR